MKKRVPFIFPAINIVTRFANNSFFILNQMFHELNVYLIYSVFYSRIKLIIQNLKWHYIFFSNDF
jgi:hypothetical protein